eukprot:TRINITY_DN10750_c0_g1_i1.p1 TRINITY_DN10750_c0_g1~~TRINITY_DN10750_c0_g1_i1.p1  ORF type:complete len:707 (+),score=132.67 TRINITY_DN10750_c0_g1_i1:119-2122(+)
MQFMDFNASPAVPLQAAAPSVPGLPAAAAPGMPSGAIDAASLQAAAATAAIGVPSASAEAVPGTPAFDMAAMSMMSAMPGFDPTAWAGIAFPSFMPPPSATASGTPDLSQQLREAQALVAQKKEADQKERGDKVDRKKAPQPPPGGDVIRLRGLPWSAGPPEVAQFLHEFGVKEKDVTMCVTESGRQDGHAWVVFDSKEVSKQAMQEKQRHTIGGRFIELFPWKDHTKEKKSVEQNQKIYHGVLKHFDAHRKCGYIFSADAEPDIGRVDIYAFKDILEKGKASVGDTLAFPLHWSPKGQPQASSPLIRIASIKSFAHTGTFKLMPPGRGGKQGGTIECKEMLEVFGRGVYVSPSIAATLTSGSLVAFNAYLTTMPLAFAKPPLDNAHTPVASKVMMVDASFTTPGPDLELTKTAEGFEHKAGQQIASPAPVAPIMRPLGGQAPAPGQEVCRFFSQNGWCKYGEGCRHAHIAASSAGGAGMGCIGGCMNGGMCGMAPSIGSMAPPPSMGGMAAPPSMGGMAPLPTINGMSLPPMSGTAPLPSMGGAAPFMGGMAAPPPMGAAAYPQTMGGMAPAPPPPMGGMAPAPPPMAGMAPAPPPMGGMSPAPPPMGGMAPAPPPMGGMAPAPPPMGGMAPAPPPMGGMAPPTMGGIPPPPTCMGGLAMGTSPSF